MRFDGFAQSYSRFRKYRETLSELNNLGERELKDLGLNRSQFRSIARTAASRG
ncbi:MAG: DUF1127 domain-containing protein [Pseudomonadota bacterium]